MKSITAYMVATATGRPATSGQSGLQIKTERAGAADTARFLDGLERDWLREYRQGPHQVIEVTITPKS